jgi:hypothetical protein
VCNRARQIDVRHALTTDLRLCNFNATLFANNATMLQALVLATQALVVFDRAKNLGTEQTVAFWFESTVVNRFRLFDFAEGPRPNHVRRRQTDTNRIEVINRVLILEKLKQIFH